MANITKRAAKRLADQLETGETIDVALLVEPRGTYGLGAVATALAPRTSSRSLEVRAAARQETEGGTAADFPAAAAVVAITSVRLIAAESNGLRFGQIGFSVPRSTVRVEHVGSGLGRRLRLVFGDGTAVEVDTQRGQPVRAFADALHSTL